MNNKKSKIIFAIAGVILSISLFYYVQSGENIEKQTGHEKEQHVDEHANHKDHADHQDHKDHENHQEDNDHEDHKEDKEDIQENENVIQLSKEDMAEFGIKEDIARSGKILAHVNLPGEVVLNEDRLAHVVPRVPGIARAIKKVLGDQVRKGEVMAVLVSRELADMKAAFLAARERVTLAKGNFLREERLWKEKISSEQEYFESRQVFAEAKIEYRSAEQKLHALGFSEKYLKQLPDQPDMSFTQYHIVAPFDGTVIEKHIVLGELLSSETNAFVIADMRLVWVDISVYQKDLPDIRKGMPVVISAGSEIPDATGTISYIGPLVDEKTRTALARVVLPNEQWFWKPGVFINAMISASETTVAVAVPKTAIQTIENQSIIFVRVKDGFKPRAVSLGRSDRVNIEVLTGLAAGEHYVSQGAFTFKAEMGKETLGDGHGH
jgi:cobalt-zinc-cadmium efflux system membrane fusion protein